MYFLQVRQLRENGAVAERNENDAMVSQRREGGVDRHLLSSTGATSRNEDASVFASEATFSPDTTGCIPEDLSWVSLRYLIY